MSKRGVFSAAIVETSGFIYIYFHEKYIIFFISICIFRARTKFRMSLGLPVVATVNSADDTGDEMFTSSP